MLLEYSGRMEEFQARISRAGEFTKDQWEIQMQLRALKRVGEENLYFVTPGIKADLLDKLSVTGQAERTKNITHAIQTILDKHIKAGCKKIAVFPEGPYCAAIIK